MHNQTESITLDVIQQKCQYQNLDTLRVFWKSEHPGVDFPKRTTPINPFLVVPFLKRVATPGRGKSETVIAGANELLALFQITSETEQNKRLEPVNPNLPRMENPPPAAAAAAAETKQPKPAHHSPG